MDSFPCTCGGENPNCFKCDGTGMLTRPAPPPQAPGRPRFPLGESRPPWYESASSRWWDSPTQSSANKQTGEKAAPKLLICPHCKVSFDRPIAFLVHIEETHYRSAITKGSTSPAPAKQLAKLRSGAPSVQCPHCAQTVWEKKLKRHIKRVHGPDAEAAKRAELERRRQKVLTGDALTEQRPGAPLIPCPPLRAERSRKELGAAHQACPRAQSGGAPTSRSRKSAAKRVQDFLRSASGR